MLIDIIDDVLDLAKLYLTQYPIHIYSLANAGDNEFTIGSESVQLIFKPAEPYSELTVEETLFICIVFGSNDKCIYIPKKYVDHPQTVYAIFLDGVWIDQFEPVDAVFETQEEANEYMALEKQHLTDIGLVKEWKS